MPHVPDLNHDGHDLELIAELAAGDARASRAAAATELVAACAACAELHDDLRAIAAAMPELPVRPRTRDYRLTAVQAASLRPSGWRRLVSAFAAPRLAFTAPLGTGLAALGIAGLLLTSAPGLFGAGASTPAAGSQERVDMQAPGTSAAPGIDNAAPAASLGISVTASDAPRDAQAEPPAGPDGPSDTAATTLGQAPLPVIFGVLLAAGVLLVAARLLARRLTARA